MKKIDVLYEILEFGKKEQSELEKQLKYVEANRIEYARRTLLCYLLKSITLLKRALYHMTNFEEAYSVFYESDDYTRELLEALAEKISKKGVKQ